MKTILYLICAAIPALAGFGILTNSNGVMHYGDPTHIRTQDDGIGCYTNLVAWYQFDRTNSPDAINGTKAVDYSVSNSPATVFIGTSSGATWVASSPPTSSAYFFSGTNQYLQTPFVVSTGKTIAACLWAKHQGLPDQASFGLFQLKVYYESNSGELFKVFFNTTAKYFAWGSANTVSRKNGSVWPTNWTHFVICFNNSDWKNATDITVYVNGTPITNDVQPTASSRVGYSAIGKIQTVTTENGFSGLIDDFRIYNIALSAQQVTNLFNATKSAHPNPAW